MSMSRIAILGVVLAGIAAVTACEKPTAPKVDKSKAIATVNGEAITENQYENLLSNIRRPISPDPAETKRVVLDQMINQTLLAQYAVDHKLDEDLDVYLAMQRAREMILIRAAEQKILKELPPFTDEQLHKRYQQEVDATDKHEYHVQHIVVTSEDEAKSVIDALNKGQSFAALAKEKSHGPTKEKGGDLGWIQQGTVVPKFFAAVQKLKKGQYTETPVKTRFGWHVIRLIDERPVKIPPFEKVKKSVIRLMQQEAIQAKLKSLRDKAKITMADGSDAKKKSDKSDENDAKPADDEKK
jgi:peptidyl-prolyl cis-trans isomerase C